MNRRQFVRSGSLLLAATPAVLRASVEHDEPEKVRLGVIGTGIRGLYILNIIRQHFKNVEVVACCDINTQNLQLGLQLAAPGARSYQNYQELLSDEKVGAVLIATPLYLHYEMARKSVEAQKHTYCEKTMCHTIDQSKELVNRVRLSPFVFQVGYQQRYNSLYKKVRQLIQNGSCGKIMYVDCFWNRNGSWRRLVKDPGQERLLNWRMYREYSGGLMAELCSHQIDIVHMMLQTLPVAVSGLGGIDYWKDGRETFDNVTALFEYPEGVKARFTALTTNAHEGFRMKFYGTKATIEINRKAGQKGIIYPESPPQNPNWELDAISGATQTSWHDEEGIPIQVEGGTDDEASTTAALADFFACIHSGKKPVADVINGHWSTVAVCMANTSMFNHSIESWKETYRPD